MNFHESRRCGSGCAKATRPARRRWTASRWTAILLPATERPWADRPSAAVQRPAKIASSWRTNKVVPTRRPDRRFARGHVPLIVLRSRRNRLRESPRLRPAIPVDDTRRPPKFLALAPRAEPPPANCTVAATNRRTLAATATGIRRPILRPGRRFQSRRTSD